MLHPLHSNIHLKLREQAWTWRLASGSLEIGGYQVTSPSVYDSIRSPWIKERGLLRKPEICPHLRRISPKENRNVIPSIQAASGTFSAWRPSTRITEIGMTAVKYARLFVTCLRNVTEILNLPVGYLEIDISRSTSMHCKNSWLHQSILLAIIILCRERASIDENVPRRDESALKLIFPLSTRYTNPYRTRMTADAMNNLNGLLLSKRSQQRV
jgi:hypothetical protein